VRVTGGYSDFDFSWPLAPGESFDTAPYYGGYSSEGFGGASRLLRRFEREEILPDRLRPHVRPVLYDSWEATGFNVDEPEQRALAQKAANLGVELLLSMTAGLESVVTTVRDWGIGSSIPKNSRTGCSRLSAM
jgi:alpha-galactosidase